MFPSSLCQSCFTSDSAREGDLPGNLTELDGTFGTLGRTLEAEPCRGRPARPSGEIPSRAPAALSAPDRYVRIRPGSLLSNRCRSLVVPRRPARPPPRSSTSARTHAVGLYCGQPPPRCWRTIMATMPTLSLLIFLYSRWTICY
jgi:hypothetical protein